MSFLLIAGFLPDALADRLLVPIFSTSCSTWQPAQDALALHGAHLGVSAETDFQAHLICPRHPHAAGCEVSSESTRGQSGRRLEEGPVSCRQLGVESSLLRVSVGLHALLPPGGVRGSDSDPLFRRCGGSLRTAQPPPSVPEVGGSSSGIESTRTADSGAARGKVGLAIFTRTLLQLQ